MIFLPSPSRRLRHILFIRHCIIYAEYHFNCWDFLPFVISTLRSRNEHFHLYSFSSWREMRETLSPPLLIVFRTRVSREWRQHMLTESMHHHDFLKLFFSLLFVIFCLRRARHKIKNWKTFQDGKIFLWKIHKNISHATDGMSWVESSRVEDYTFFIFHQFCIISRCEQFHFRIASVADDFT